MRQNLPYQAIYFSRNRNSNSQGLPTAKQIVPKQPPSADKTQPCVSFVGFPARSIPIPGRATSSRRAEPQPLPMPFAKPPQISFPYLPYSFPDSISFARSRPLARLYCDLEVPSLMFSIAAISLWPYPSIAKRLKTILHPSGKDCTIKINSEKWKQSRLISSVS